MNISTGQLFADLQTSYTEVVLLEMLYARGWLSQSDRERMQANLMFIDTIKEIMDDRFTVDDIQSFLEDGYPRTTDLGIIR